MRTILTKEGRQKIQEELNHLLTVEKNKAISDLAEARESGPLEENTQYLVAKDAYEKLQVKINKLQTTLANATIVEASDLTTDKVMILTTVKVLNIKSPLKSSPKEMIFHIVPENEIDIKLNKISSNSPIGAGLIGKKVDDICQIQTPAGIFEFKILEITV